LGSDCVILELASGLSPRSLEYAAGDRFHGIVGRGIYQAENMHAAAVEHASQL
jgi:hypothetical protein